MKPKHSSSQPNTSRLAKSLFFATTAISVLTLSTSIAYAETNTTTSSPSQYHMTPNSTTQGSSYIDDEVDDGKIGLSAGVNVILANSAYDMDDTTVSVLPSVFYDNGKVYARGSQFGGYLINDGNNEVAGFIQVAGNQFDPDDANGALKQLDERKWSAMAGVSYLRRTPIGGLRGQVATDITGHSEGTLARLTYLARFTTNNWTIYPSLGLEWVDEDYNDYYYGVSQDEANNSGVSHYTPDSSISPYISINAFYDINEDWDAFLGQSVTYLADEQYDSPMVDDRVSHRTTLGLLYKF